MDIFNNEFLVGLRKVDHGLQPLGFDAVSPGLTNALSAPAKILAVSSTFGNSFGNRHNCVE
jgi:hypothetical protein